MHNFHHLPGLMLAYIAIYVIRLTTTMVARSHKYWTTSSATQSCHRQVDNAGWMSPWLAIVWWRLLPSSTSPGIAQTTVEGLTVNWCHKSVEGRLAIGYGGQFHFFGRPPTIRLPGFDLRRRQWSLLNRFRTGQGHCNACHKKWGFTDNELCDWRNPDNVTHHQLLSIDQVWWRSTALTWSRWGCRWLADNMLLAHDNNNNYWEIFGLADPGNMIFHLSCWFIVWFSCMYLLCIVA